jgi:hypothetical protein
MGRIVREVAVKEDAVQLALDPSQLCKALGLDPTCAQADALSITVPVRIRRTGQVVRFVLEAGHHAAAQPVDHKLVAAILKGRAWWGQLTANTCMTVADLAKAEGVTPGYVDRLLRLAFLSPGIVTAVLEGTAPAGINLERLRDTRCITPSWAEQHGILRVPPALGR